MKLPPNKIRRNGSQYQNDDNYKKLSFIEADRVLNYNPTNIIEIGCGCGRLPLFLKERGYSGKYTGLDADLKAVEWAKENISDYKFVFFDGYNARFNPKGTVKPYEFQLAKEKYDFAYMYAIFPHMLIDDIVSWCIQIYESLLPDGYFFTTCHSEYIDKPIIINMPNYPKGYTNEKSTLHHVVYNRIFLENIFIECGFNIIEITEEWNTQTGYLLQK